MDEGPGRIQAQHGGLALLTLVLAYVCKLLREHQVWRLSALTIFSSGFHKDINIEFLVFLLARRPVGHVFLLAGQCLKALSAFLVGLSKVTSMGHGECP